MAVNIKMGVDVGGFKSGIREGQTILKGLNAQMKSAEAEFKATGNAEKYMADKASTLNSQLNVQKGVVDQAQKALDTMTKAGVDPADAAYQQMYATLMNAQASMYQTQAALNGLESSAEQAAGGADQLTESVNSIGKKISLDQVISGIGKITDGLESAAKKAISLGETIWNTIMDTAAWSDDIATLADKLGLSTDEVQKMKAVAAEFEAPVETIAKTWKKLQMNMTSDSDDIQSAFEQVGVSLTEVVSGGKYGPITQMRDYKDVFWEVGEALVAMGEGADRERLAQQLLGRSWDELAPLFKAGREEYESALEAQSVASEDAIRNNAALNDSVKQLEENFNIFKAQVLGDIAPELQKVTDTFSSLLSAIVDYLKTEDGQKMLEGVGNAIGDLVDDISKIDPETVVSGFISAIDGLVGALQWIVDNKDTLVGALEAVVAGWGLLKLTGGALEILKLINGIRGLTNVSAISTAGATAGASWGSAFGSAVMTAIPWLAGLLVLFDTSNHGNDNLIDKDGNLTQTAIDAGYSLDEGGNLTRDDRQIAADAAQAAWDLYRTNKLDQEAIFDLQNALGNDIAMQQLFEIMQGAKQTENWKDIEDLNIDEWLKQFDVEIPGEVDLPDDQKQLLEDKIGTLELPAEVKYVEAVGDTAYPHRHANGLSYVPYDGYLAELHRGEMVVPAREVSNSNYSSNLYVESMIMNNGTDAEGLAAAMAAAQRRTMSGYGS